jgi:hypothetical protein
MTQIQAMSHDIRRHPDGSIDFDFYRVRATALRRQAMQGAFAVRPTCAGVLTIVGALFVVFLVVGAPIRAPNSHAAMALTNVAPTR